MSPLICFGGSNRDVSLQELSNYTITARYARHKPELKRRETWAQATDRMMDMHVVKYAGFNAYIEESTGIVEVIDECRKLVKEKRILGSQRALQFGGEPILKKNARIYNCCASYLDRVRFFQECFWLLLCGCGTGFSVQKHHVAKLPSIHQPNPYLERVYQIPDNIEGWSDAVGALVDSYFTPGSATVTFLYDLIRPKGSKLSSSSGFAPGPEPLRNALEKVRQVFENALAMGLTQLRPIDAYDIVMHLCDAVLSGGVRRSATICIFSPDDEEMVRAKTGNWFVENPQRGRSNNSALLLRDRTTWKAFQKLMASVKEFGEPGFYWADSTEILPNPCVEIGFYPVDPLTGATGWHFCNLSEINGKKCKTLEDFLLAAKGAAALGTIQAGYSNFSYLGEVTERIVKHEALLGVSITGMMDNPDVLFNAENQRKAVKVILDENERVAGILGINPAARVTCIKPSGTASCVLGTASGIHPHHYNRYFRRVQANKMEAPFQHFAKINPLAVEDSVWDPNGATGVITFCVEVEPGAKLKNQLSAVDLLEHVKTTQQNWVLPGVRKERCLHPQVSHNVSNTINVKPDEWDDVTVYIYKNRKYFAGISLLPITGDKDYAQAPFCAVYTKDEMIKHYGDGALFASGVIEAALEAFGGDLWAACDAALGFREPSKGFWVLSTYHPSLQESWVEKVKKFSEKYFEGNLRKTTYCLKDVHNRKLWIDLTREYRSVDYSEMYEEEDNRVIEADAACAGGQCLI